MPKTAIAGTLLVSMLLTVPQLLAQGQPSGTGAPPRKRPTAAPRGIAPPPFRLTREQLHDLWAVLKAWEQRARGIETLRADFILWKYDLNFNPNKPAIYYGELRYKAPDKGMYRYRENEKAQWIEDWSCDGQAIYRLDHAKKQLVVHPLPPELRGRAITQGPLPFVLGADAQTLLNRYYMRLVTPEQRAKQEIWLEAWPKRQQDRADFQTATVIFRKQDLVPFAVQLVAPGGKNRDVYQFNNLKINGGFLQRLFGQETFTPPLPRGWTRVVQPIARPSRSAGRRQPLPPARPFRR